MGLVCEMSLGNRERETHTHIHVELFIPSTYALTPYWDLINICSVHVKVLLYNMPTRLTSKHTPLFFFSWYIKSGVNM